MKQIITVGSFYSIKPAMGIIRGLDQCVQPDRMGEYCVRLMNQFQMVFYLKITIKMSNAWGFV